MKSKYFNEDNKNNEKDFENILTLFLELEDSFYKKFKKEMDELFPMISKELFPIVERGESNTKNNEVNEIINENIIEFKNKIKKIEKLNINNHNSTLDESYKLVLDLLITIFGTKIARDHLEKTNYFADEEEKNKIDNIIYLKQERNE